MNRNYKHPGFCACYLCIAVKNDKNMVMATRRAKRFTNRFQSTQWNIKMFWVRLRRGYYSIGDRLSQAALRCYWSPREW